MIEVKECSLCFEDKNAVDGITISIPEGTAYGLLGSNGAGKSTLLRMLCGIYKPSKGSVKIDGEDVYDNVKIKENIFFINDETQQYSDMTVEEMKKYFARFYPSFSTEVFDKLIDIVDLPRKKKMHTFSKGMKRQAVVICGIASKTKYLFLDEAFDGLDPAMRNIVKNMLIDAMLDNHLTVIFSSHNMREIDEFCDRVGLIHAGKALFDCELDNLKSNTIKIQASFDSDVTASDFPGIEILSIDKVGSITYIIAKGGSELIRNEIMKKSPKLYDEIRLSLEEIFIYEMEGVGYDSSKLDK